MHKKIFSGLLGLLLVLIGVVGLTLTAAPANASESQKEPVCHATASDSNPYALVTVARDSIVNGGHGVDGVNAGDLIPPFDYNFNGGAVEHYAGQNWNADADKLMSQGCTALNTVLTPVLPVAPVETCTAAAPTLVIPAQPAGIDATSAADGKGGYTVLFGLPKNTLTQTYSLPKDFVNPVTVTTVDGRTSDAYWDAAKGVCALPDTGAGQNVQWWMIPAAAGMFLLAALLFTANTGAGSP